MSIKQIPNWVYTGSLPAFYDVESGTAIEQTARLHGYVKSLIDDYNLFVKTLTEETNKFVEESNQDQEDFKTEITKIMHDYIMMIDDKIKMLDNAVSNQVIAYMDKAFDEGKIVISVEYDENNENINITGGVNNG